MLRPPPISTLFPYTTLFRSCHLVEVAEGPEERRVGILLSFCPEQLLDLSGAEHIGDLDRKSTRLNSSHVAISYAVFCLKKKKTTGTAPMCTEYEAGAQYDPT